MMLAIFIAIFFISPGLCESQTSRTTTCTGENVYYNEKTNTCEECPTTCPAGSGYFWHKCGNGQMKRERCNECTAGKTYSTADDDLRCFPCNMCINREMVTNCTATSKATCGQCDNDYGWDHYREECKLCKFSTEELPLPGCEQPPKVTVSKMKVERVVCESTADKYSWFRNGEILDTSDQTKFADLGKMLLILEPDKEDGDVYYECRAEWKADKNHDFVIKKMSSNKAEVEKQETTPTYTTIQEETKNENVTDKPTNSSTTVTRSVNKGCLKGWLILAAVGGSFFFLFLGVCLGVGSIGMCMGMWMSITPLHKIFNWIREKINNRNIRKADDRVEKELSLAESEMVSLEEGVIDTGQSSSETSGLMQKTNQYNDNLGSLYETAVECSSGLYYHDLTMKTTDRIRMLLNPHDAPLLPIKYWIHLADELGFTNQAELNYIGTYKRFHNFLLTKDIPMERFLKALWVVDNAEAIKVVCNEVINKQKSSESLTV